MAHRIYPDGMNRSLRSLFVSARFLGFNADGRRAYFCTSQYGFAAFYGVLFRASGTPAKGWKITEARCSCSDFYYRNLKCKHLIRSITTFISGQGGLSVEGDADRLFSEIEVTNEMGERLVLEEEVQLDVAYDEGVSIRRQGALRVSGRR